MKLLGRKSGCFVRLLLALGLAMIVSGLNAQEGSQTHQRIGLPHDWTHSHVLFSGNALLTNPALAEAEPRVVHQWLRQNLARFPNSAAHRESEFRSHHKSPLHRDWSVSLGTGRVAAGMSPAKFSFDTTALPDCANDYVVFGLAVAGTAGQANLIAFNDLYSGPGGICNATNPSVFFSYNTSTIGGTITTSPVLSLDGKKIAFVETTGGSSIFHVLTWATGAGNGTSATTPAVPGVGNTASMTSLTYAAANNTRSSPWIDYKNDIAYVGANNGRVYKITGVFNGTPTLAGAPWPLNVGGGNTITSPVLDYTTGRLFVGDTVGRLSSVNYVTPGTVATLAVGSATNSTNRAVRDAPIVDQSNGVVYAISSNDGTSAVLVQASTATLTELARARIGQGSTTGTTVNLYDGSPDNSYFNAPATGSFLVCGTGAADTTPTLYSFGFVGTTLNTAPTSTAQIVNNQGARCSPITEFFNPNVGTGGTDFFFFGLTSNCLGRAGSGCVMSLTGGSTMTTGPAETGGTSSIVMDNESLSGQASSIYFTTLAAPNRAVKVTQSGLQ
jgi:hypothetical protein